MRIKDMLADHSSALARIIQNQREDSGFMAEKFGTMAAKLDRISTKLDNRPVQLSDEQLDKVLSLREPLSIPEHAAELVREVARYGPYTYMQHMGSGSFVTADWSLNPDGTIGLALQAPNGSPFWRGTFRGPDA